MCRRKITRQAIFVQLIMSFSTTQIALYEMVVCEINKPSPADEACKCESWKEGKP